MRLCRVRVRACGCAAKAHLRVSYWVLCCTVCDVVQVWDMESLGCRRTLKGHGSHAVLTVSLTAEYAVSGDAGGHILVWSRDTWQCTRVLTATSRHAPASSAGSGSPLRTGVAPPISVQALLAEAGERPGELTVLSGWSDAAVRIWELGEAGSAAAGSVTIPAATPTAPAAVTSSSSGGGDMGSGRGSKKRKAGALPIGSTLSGTHGNSALSETAAGEDSGDGDAGGTAATSTNEGRARTASASFLSVRRGNELENALATFVAFRSVSADEACREECWRCAKFLSALLETHIGASVRLAPGADGRNPVVMGRVGNDASKPTVGTCACPWCHSRTVLPRRFPPSPVPQLQAFAVRCSCCPASHLSSVPCLLFALLSPLLSFIYPSTSLLPRRDTQQTRRDKKSCTATTTSCLPATSLRGVPTPGR